MNQVLLLNLTACGISFHYRSLFAKVANLLKFPNSPRLSRLPTPKHVTNKVHKLEKIKEVQTARRNARKEKKEHGTPILSVN